MQDGKTESHTQQTGTVTLSLGEVRLAKIKAEAESLTLNLSDLTRRVYDAYFEQKKKASK